VLRWLWLSGLVLVLDQFTKWLAAGNLQYGEPVPLVPMLALTLAHNYGAAFSFLGDASGWQRWFFIVLAMVVSIVLLLWLRRLQRHEQRVALALALILGGAIGNVIDRLLYGYVIDFIDVYYGDWHWPVFNVADSAISVGAALLLFDALFSRHAHRDAA
jgi:signal peptidase II